jgi:hypothetical protein
VNVSPLLPYRLPRLPWRAVLHRSGKTDAFGGELVRQPAVAIAIKLRPKRRSGGNPDVKQAQLGIVRPPA